MIHNKELVNRLIEKGYKISAAESCTGGMFAAKIVEVADASKVFDMSFVTYANEAKIKLVNVKEETIKEFGVVSEEVAIQMAKGVKEVSGADIGVGISGIAGPRGGTPEKPVGMVCFGIAIGNKTISMTKQFGDLGRNIVREKAVEYIIELLLMLI